MVIDWASIVERVTPCYLRKRFGFGCYKCGTLQYLGYSYYVNGLKKDFCADCWPGYNSCGTLGCGHFQCEHSFGEMVYAASGEDPSVEEIMPSGCMNAGCPCTSYTSESAAYAKIHLTEEASRAAYYKLSEIAGVYSVSPSISVVVSVNTWLAADDKALRVEVYKAQSELCEKYPSVTFDFSVTSGIRDHE